MTSNIGQVNMRLVGLFLAIQVISLYFLWTLNTVNEIGEGRFAIFLAVDMVSFAMISYVYRAYKNNEQLNKGLVFGGCCMIIVLFFASFVL